MRHCHQLDNFSPLTIAIHLMTASTETPLMLLQSLPLIRSSNSGDVIIRWSYACQLLNCCTRSLGNVCTSAKSPKHNVHALRCKRNTLNCTGDYIHKLLLLPKPALGKQRCMPHLWRSFRSKHERCNYGIILLGQASSRMHLRNFFAVYPHDLNGFFSKISLTHATSKAHVCGNAEFSRQYSQGTFLCMLHTMHMHKYSNANFPGGLEQCTDPTHHTHTP